MKNNYFKKVILGTAHFDKEYGVVKKKFQISGYQKIFKELNKRKTKIIFDTSLGYKNSFNVLEKFQNYNFNINHKILINQSDARFKKKILLEIKKVQKILKIKKINAILLHDEKIIHSKNFSKIYSFLIQLKKKNYFKSFGYSIYNFPVYKKSILRYKPDILQIPYNIIDDRVSKEDLILLRKKKINIQARSIFLQGLLLLKYNSLPKKFKKYEKFWKKFDKQFSFRLNLKEKFLISYPFKNKYINNVILGNTNIQQLKKLLTLRQNNAIYFPMMNKKDKLFLTNPVKWL